MVREWRVEVVGHDEDSLVDTEPPRAPRIRRDEARDRLSSSRDHDLLTSGNTPQKLGESRLRLVNSHRRHFANTKLSHELSQHGVLMDWRSQPGNSFCSGRLR